MKKIPYGIADFKEIQEKDYLYVDNTMYIPKLEAAGKYLFFLRPRRFGKTLFLNVLESYYDRMGQDAFDTLFAGTYIADHPTPEKHAYLILKFNFSQVNPDPGSVESSFQAHVETQMFFFSKRYRDFLDDDYFEMMDRYAQAYEKLEFLLKYAGSIGQKVYVSIDEYDNFANTIFSMHGQQNYQQLTHGAGFLRFFFNVLKGGASDTGAGLGRLFITGVSPITMDDVTSGFNIGRNITLEAPFHQLLGFTRNDVLRTIRYYRQSGCRMPAHDAAMLDVMREWYDGYCFSKGRVETLFNTDMVLYFLQHVLAYGTYPDEMIDENIRIDYGKLRHFIVLNRQLNGNFQRLSALVETEHVQSPIIKHFPVENIAEPDNFTSLLFYFGLLSAAHAKTGEEYLKIPNRTIKTLFYGYLRESYKDVDVFRLDAGHLAHLVHAMAYHGEWEPVFQFLARHIEEQTRIRDYLTGEKVVQTFLLAYLNVVDYYLTRSEEEMGKGYADLFLEPFLAKYPDIPYACLIEIKYIPRKEWSETIQAEKYSETVAQLRQYAADTHIRKRIQGAVLKCLVLVFSGWELTLAREIAPDALTL